MLEIKQTAIRIIKNPILIYLSSRYVVFGIQFITQLVLINRLEQFYFGIWGAVLLWVGIGQTINFGITTCSEILIVKNHDKELEKKIVFTSIVLNSLLILFPLIVLGLTQIIQIDYIKKYDIGKLIYLLPFIIVFMHLSSLFAAIQRIKNQYFLFVLSQSLFPLTCFAISFIGKERVLLTELIIGYLMSYAILTIIGVIANRSSLNVRYFELGIAKEIIKSGFYLFVYASGYLLIMLTTKFLISCFYMVDEFGSFVFALQLGNAAMMLINSFLSLINPKIIEMMSSGNYLEIKERIRNIRELYSTTINCTIYLMIIAGSVFIHLFFFGKTSVIALVMIMLTLLMNANACPYNTFLISQKREKIVAKIIIYANLINIASIFILKVLFDVTYEYCVLGTLIAFFYYIVATVISSEKVLSGITILECIKIAWPLKLAIPFVVALCISLSKISVLLFLPLILLIILNFKELLNVIKTINTLIFQPHIIELNNK